MHRGVPHGAFKQSFNLADHVKVAGAALEDGLLTIDLVREIPEPLKPRRIDISSGVRGGEPKRIDEASPKPLKISVSA